MQLHLVKISPCCRAVWSYCLQNKLEVELIDVDVLAGELKSEAFCKLNPHGELPVLVDGDNVVSSVYAIIEYLALKYTNMSCYGETVQQTLLTKSLLSWTCSHLHTTTGYRVVYPNFMETYQLEDDGTEVLIEKGTLQLTEYLETLEKVFLATSKYLTGDTSTIADVYVATVLVQLEWIDFDFALWPKLNAWLKKIKTSEHWSLVHEKHHGFLSELRKHGE